jgi:hypothetical protein
MSIGSEMLRHGRALLDAARADRQTWKRFRVSIAKQDDSTTDLHASDRMQLTWALQYDAHETDAELIRFALAEEVAWRSVAPYQGIGEVLETLGWLVARDRNIADLALLVEAKLANFDTSCGFDREHLFTAGVKATLAHARAHPSLASVVIVDGKPAHAQHEIDRWFASRAHRFVTDLEAEPATLWIDRALALGDLDLARQLVHAWSSSAETLSLLIYYLHEVGDHEAEAAARARAIEQTTVPFDIAHQLQRLADAERRAGRTAHAFAALSRAADLHRAEPSWRELGLGRSFVQSCFELAETGDLDIARAAFALGDGFAATTPRLPPDAHESAVRAADRLAHHDRASHYRAALGRWADN